MVGRYGIAPGGGGDRCGCSLGCGRGLSIAVARWSQGSETDQGCEGTQGRRRTAPSTTSCSWSSTARDPPRRRAPTMPAMLPAPAGRVPQRSRAGSIVSERRGGDRHRAAASSGAATRRNCPAAADESTAPSIRGRANEFSDRVAFAGSGNAGRRRRDTDRRRRSARRAPSPRRLLQPRPAPRRRLERPDGGNLLRLGATSGRRDRLHFQFKDRPDLGYEGAELNWPGDDGKRGLSKAFAAHRRRHAARETPRTRGIKSVGDREASMPPGPPRSQTTRPSSRRPTSSRASPHLSASELDTQRESIAAPKLLAHQRVSCYTERGAAASRGGSERLAWRPRPPTPTGCGA